MFAQLLGAAVARDMLAHRKYEIVPQTSTQQMGPATWRADAPDCNRIWPCAFSCYRYHITAVGI